MLLYLRILTYRNQSVPPSAPVGFSGFGGAIGRATENDLVLDDTSKYISRVHAKVSWRDNVFYLEDVGSNPSVVNDRPLGKGREVALADGDRVTIGDYQLQAVVEAGVAAPKLPQAFVNNTELPLFEPPPPPAQVQLPALELLHKAEPAPDMLAMPMGLPDALAGASILDVSPGDRYNVGGHDPLGLNLFGIGPALPMHGADSDHVSPELAAFAMPSLFGSGAALPAALPPIPAAAPQAPYTPPQSPFSAPPAPVAPLPHAAFGAPPAAAAQGGFSIPADYDPLADFFAPPIAKPAPPPAYIAPPAPVVESVPEAPYSTPFTAPLPEQVSVFVEPEPAPEALPPAPVAVPAWIAPPPVSPTPAPTPPSAPVQPAAVDSSSDGNSEVLQALLRGLGLPNLRIERPATEVAEIVGSMLREATAGTIDVLMARAVTKKESRMDVTILSVRENNPLKFFPNAEGALTQMLTGSMAGYMAPSQAMAGAFDDLRAHELAVIAGMRAALGAVLHRFDPEKIEARLAVPTVMDKMLSSNRKAKMWDRLVELYGEIAREADDDLQRLFGEKFSEAYEDQVARLRQAKRQNKMP